MIYYDVWSRTTTFNTIAFQLFVIMFIVAKNKSFRNKFLIFISFEISKNHQKRENLKSKKCEFLTKKWSSSQKAIDIKLCSAAHLRTSITPKQNFQMYLDQFTHHIENPLRYQNTQNKICSTHAISRLRKIE